MRLFLAHINVMRLVYAFSWLAAAIAWSLASHSYGQTVSDDSPSKDSVSLSYVFSDDNLSATLESFRQLTEQYPELRDRVSVQFLTESLFEDISAEALISSKVVVFDVMSHTVLERFNQAHDVDIIENVSDSGTVLAVGIDVQSEEYFIEKGATFNDTAQAYWRSGGANNRLSLMKYALSLAGIEGLELVEVEGSLDFGYYLPSPGGGDIYGSWSEFEAARGADPEFDPDKPSVAIGFYKNSYYNGDTSVIDAVVAEVLRQGGNPVPLFGDPGDVAFERLLINDDGSARADVGLSFLTGFASFDSAASLTGLNIPFINMITLRDFSEQEWRDSETGMSMSEGTYQIAVPELGGLIAPTVVGSRERQSDPLTGETITVDSPILPRVEMAVARGLRYAQLARTPVAQRRIAIVYYNYPVGAANIGANYLNIAESLESILVSMAEAGYDVGQGLLGAESILADMTEKARNIGIYAPGELQEMMNSGAAALVPIDEYGQWLAELAPALNAKIIADWGEPREAELMLTESDGEKTIVIPRLQYGNITLMPQPARGWAADLDRLYHAEDLAPHHQYAAAYLWLRKQQQVNAIVHLGTHGTLEWLGGKDLGQSREDASDALIGDVPNINIYSVDAVGEGLVAKRRGMAAIVDHMVPPFVAADLYSDLAAINESINDYHNNLHKNEELSRAFASQIVKQLSETGISKTLPIELTLNEEGQLEHEVLHAAQTQLALMRGEFIPYGLHSFGQLPSGEAIEGMADAIFGTDRSELPDPQFYYSSQIRNSIVNSAPAESDGLLNALAGRFISTGTGGDPIRNPNSYPTGKNFYGIDPDKIPKKAAWELGTKLADDMLARHVAQHGKYPEKVSFVIRGDETMRHEGIVESQVFYLLGTRPVWDVRDKVVGVEVIPSRELGRPRIDIVIGSAAEGMFDNVTRLMDEAVQRVKLLEETENFVRDHYLETKAKLIDMGYGEEDADLRAGVRIFDEPSGTYNLNTARIAANSGSWDDNVGMANDYINKMGYGYGNGFWGEPMQDIFKMALSDVETVVHSSSTMLYGALDNDDFFMYMGGLASAVELMGGTSPELLITNTRNPSNPEMSSINNFIGTEFATRYINPKWIEGMQAEGYAGARSMLEFVEYMWGWDSAVTGVVDDTAWQQTFEVYVQDKHNLEMDEFFDQASPFAFQDMTARMIETVRKDYWQADAETLSELLNAYVNSVSQHGLSCSDVTCANPRLMEYILEEGEKVGIDGVSLAELRQAIEQALQADLEQLARAAEEFAARNDAQITALYQQAELTEGYRMEPVERVQPPQFNPKALNVPWLSYLLQAFMLLVLVAWWYRRRYLDSSQP